MTVTDGDLAKRVQRSDFATRLFVVFIIVCAIATLASLVVLAVSIRTTQLEGSPIGKKLAESSDRILDCTDPGDAATRTPPGKCFTDAQERTAQAVTAITDQSLRVSAAIAYCQSTGVHEYKPLVKCAVRLVAGREKKP